MTKELFEKFLMALGALFLMMTAFHWVKRNLLPMVEGQSASTPTGGK